MSEDKQKEPFHWRTAISYKTLDRIVVRGYDVNELAGNVSFAEMLHLVWMDFRNGISQNSMKVKIPTSITGPEFGIWLVIPGKEVSSLE